MSHPPRRAHHAWYGAVMGTGVVAVSAAAEAQQWGWAWLEVVAELLLLLASVLAVVLLPRYVARLRDGGGLRAELADVARGPMLATLPAGLLVLSVAWGRVGPLLVPVGAALTVAAVLLVVGAVLALVVGLAWTRAVARSQPGLAGVSGGWLVPPVMNLLVPLAVVPLAAAHPAAAPLLLLVGLVFFGIGLLLFLALLPLVVARLAIAAPTPGMLAPSLLIPLAPAGIIGVVALRLRDVAAVTGVADLDVALAVTAAAMALGFGLWWAAFAVLELARLRRDEGIPAHPGWWGFVFPVGAMTLSTILIGSATDVAAVQVLGLIAFVGLVLLWVRVALTTRPRRATQA